MSTLAALFQGERIKWRRSWAFVAAVLPPLCQVGFLLLIFWFSEIQADKLGPGFQVWYQVNHAAWNIIFMPITVALVTLLSWEQEETAGAWKHLLIQPVPRRAHYLAKLLSHSALLLISQVVFTTALVLSSMLLRQHASYLTMGPQRLDLAWRLALFSFLAALPLLGLHTWMSTRWRGVGLALAITLVGSLLTSLLVAQVFLARWLPWGLASQAVSLGVNGVKGAWAILFGALLLAALLATLGTLDFSHREEQR
jgi:hypothetical protein